MQKYKNNTNYIVIKINIISLFKTHLYMYTWQGHENVSVNLSFFI